MSWPDPGIAGKQPKTLAYIPCKGHVRGWPALGSEGEGRQTLGKSFTLGEHSEGWVSSPGPAECAGSPSREGVRSL